MIASDPTELMSSQRMKRLDLFAPSCTATTLPVSGSRTIPSRVPTRSAVSRATTGAEKARVGSSRPRSWVVCFFLELCAVVGDGGTESGEVFMDEAVHLVRHDECGA